MFARPLPAHGPLAALGRRHHAADGLQRVTRRTGRPIASLVSSPRELRPTSSSGFLAHPVRLSHLPLHGTQPQRLAARGEPGVLPAVSGAAVPVHHQSPIDPGSASGPDGGWPAAERAPVSACPMPCPICPGWGGTSTCATTPQGTGGVPLQLLHWPGAGRTPGGQPGFADDCGAHRRVRAAAQRGRRVAHGAPERAPFGRELLRNP